MNGRGRFRQGGIIPVFMVSVSLLSWPLPGNAAGGAGQGCTDCHKAGSRSPGGDPKLSHLVHIGGVNPHRASAPADPAAGGQRTGPAPTPSPRNTPVGAPGTR